MSQKNSVNIFMPIRKVDEETRQIHGLVTEEIVDQSGEILDYDTSKAYFQDWSDGIAKATDGASAGNLRLMHQPIVAGKIVSLDFDDSLKQISCVAEIVSDEVWKLVVKGCLTGFSMGGKYVKKWADAANKAVTRFTAKPVEVSVVDNPCVQTATFQFQKTDGSIEIRKFHSVGDDTMITNDMVLARAQELAKAAGAEAPTDDHIAEARVLLEGDEEARKAAGGEDPVEEQHQDPAQTPEAEPTPEDQQDTEARRADAAKTLVQVWQAPDGRTFAKKDAAVTAILAGPAPTETAVEKALREARGEPAPSAQLVLPPELQELSKTLETLSRGLEQASETLAPDLVRKGLYETSELASLVAQFRYVVLAAAYEAKDENDSSPVPAKLMEALVTMGQALVMMAQEEVAEMITMIGSNIPDVDILALSDGIVELSALVEMTKANEAVMEKAGARNSASDKKKIQAMHDNSVDLGADCSASKSVTIDNIEELPDDVVESLPVVKALRADLGTQTTEVEKAIQGIAALGEQVASLTTELTALKNAPRALPPRTDHVIVERGGVSKAISAEDIEKMSPEDRADLMIRISQTAPFTPQGMVGR